MSELKETGEPKDAKPTETQLDMEKIQASMQGPPDSQTQDDEAFLIELEAMRRQQDRDIAMDAKSEITPRPPYVTTDAVEGSEWFDKGIQDVPVSELPWPEGVNGPEDFEHHISYDDTVNVTQRLQEMKPLIDQGYTSEDFAQLDKANGLNFDNGQQRIYELYYGDRAIKAYKDGGNYDVPSGRHRLFVAKEMGLDSIPVHLKQKAE